MSTLISSPEVETMNRDDHVFWVPSYSQSGTWPVYYGARMIGWFLREGEARDYAMYRNRLLSARENDSLAPDFRHKQRGTIYRIEGLCTLQTEKPLGDECPLLLYSSEQGNMWARTPEEFGDGRFERIILPT